MLLLWTYLVIEANGFICPNFIIPEYKSCFLSLYFSILILLLAVPKISTVLPIVGRAVAALPAPWVVRLWLLCHPVDKLTWWTIKKLYTTMAIKISSRITATTCENLQPSNQLFSKILWPIETVEIRIKVMGSKAPRYCFEVFLIFPSFYAFHGCDSLVSIRPIVAGKMPIFTL